MYIHFNPSIRTVKHIDAKFTSAQIEDEPMLFGASLRYARENGSEITNTVLNAIHSDPEFDRMLVNTFQADNDLNVIIDTKSVMVTKGQYPSIPGWHCDDVPRSSKNSQPDFSETTLDVQHFLVFFSDVGDLTGTEFVTSNHSLVVDENQVWGSVNNEIENMLNTPYHQPHTRKAKDGELIQFNQLALHRATPAKSYGWRYFFRLSFTRRPHINKLRKQVQVYADASVGW